MGRGRHHRPNCQCGWCDKRKKEVKVEIIDPMKHIENWPRDKCEDELASLRYAILARVSQLSKYWGGLIEMNKRKERIQERLAELGVKIKDQ